MNTDPSHPPRAHRVLLVNRHPALRRQLTALFSQALPGTDVRAVDGIAAARREAAAEPVDTVLVDTRLDDGCALDLAGWLRRVSPRTTLVFLSLAASEAVQAAIERLGGARHVDKQAIDAALVTDLVGGGGAAGVARAAGGHIPFLMPGFAPAD